MRMLRFSCAAALLLSAASAFAQQGQGTSPLTGAKGGTNNAFMQFTGPASSIKTYTLPNASDTIAMLAAIQTFTGTKTFNSAKLLLAGSSSGTTELDASATASGILTLPAATDTLVGRNTTDTLTNKTLTSPVLTTPTLGVASATSINKVAITAPASSATLTIPDGVTLTGPASSGTAMTLGNTETVTGVKTFGSSGAVGRLKIAGTTSGSTVLDASATASGTLTLPATTDTLVGKATTDTLTNKTLTSPSLTTPTSSAPVSTGIADNQGTLKLSGFVTSTQISSNQNNYTATDGSNTCTTKLELRVSSDASRNISGLSCSQAEGDIRIVSNVGANNVVLTNQDTNSTAANRMLLSGDITLGPDTSIALRYDGVTSRWRPIVSPGAGGSFTAATKSDQQTGTSNTVGVTPLHQQDHDSAEKAWVIFTGATGAILASYNVSTVGHPSTGNFTVNFTTAFASANYVCNINHVGSLGYSIAASLSTGSAAIQSSNGTTSIDPTSVMVSCRGRQ